MRKFETRVGAYAVIVRDGKILLAHFTAYGESNWTLPGGGLELGEDAEQAVVREVHEETGYEIVLNGLLGVNSVQIPAEQRIDGSPIHLHSLRILYAAKIVSGEMRSEVDGSTDETRWFDLKSVKDLYRVELVDTGITMWKNGNRSASDGDGLAVPETA